MLMVWFNQKHEITSFTPAWAFLVFPMMLVGVVAFNTLKVIPPEDPRALGVLLVGYVFQGLGFFMTFFYICIYILRQVSRSSVCAFFLTLDFRIMMTGFMDGHQANGAFVACGPPGKSLGVFVDSLLNAFPGFTALALIQLGAHARKM